MAAPIEFNAMTPARKSAAIGVGLALLATLGVVVASIVMLIGLGEMPEDLSVGDFFAIVPYVYLWGEYEDVAQWARIGGLSGGAVVVLGFVMILVRTRSVKALHGDARFANEREIRRAGLRDEDGIVVGYTGKVPAGYGKRNRKGAFHVFPKTRLNGKNVLRAGGDSHVVIFAPSRSGKGAGIVVPTLHDWQYNAFCLDIKKENWHRTAGFRAGWGQELFLFSPYDEEGRTSRWNPLDSVRVGTPHQPEDLDQIASTLIRVDPANRNKFFDEQARIGFIGIAGLIADLGVHVEKQMEAGKIPLTLGQVAREAYAGGNLKAYLMAILKYCDENKVPLGERTHMALSGFIGHEGKTFGDVASSLKTALKPWAMSPLLDAATCESDFRLENLATRPMSVYLGITPEDLVRGEALMNLFLQQCQQLNTKTRQAVAEGSGGETIIPLLMVMDEFPQVGHSESFKRAMGFLAGYKVRALIVAQSIGQIEDIYGHQATKAIIDNCSLEVFFPTKDEKGSQALERSLGTRTVTVTSRSKPRLFGRRGSHSTTHSEMAQPLVRAQDIRAAGSDTLWLMARGTPPVEGNRIQYFVEQGFVDNAALPPPEVPLGKERDEGKEPTRILGHILFGGQHCTEILNTDPAEENKSGKKQETGKGHQAIAGPAMEDTEGQDGAAIAVASSPAEEDAIVAARAEMLAFVKTECDRAILTANEKRLAIEKAAKLFDSLIADGKPADYLIGSEAEALYAGIVREFVNDRVSGTSGDGG